MRRFVLPALIALAWGCALLFGGPGSATDSHLLLAAQQGDLVSTARLLTRLGDSTTVLAAAGLTAAWLWWKRLPGRALVLVGTLLSCRLLVELQKLVFDRVRPDPQGHLTAVHSMAFPSGHAANAMAAYLAVALIVFADSRLRGVAVGAGVAVAVLVGLTRLVLGVHWPSDVLGGWAFGALCAMLGARLALGTSPAPRH